MTNQKKDKADLKRGLKRYNRTPLTSYYRSETESGERSPFTRRPIKKDHRKIVFGLIDIILVVSLLAGLFYSLLLTTSPQVSVSSTAYHNQDDYKNAVDNAFNSLKNRNKISFDQSSIDSKLQQQFPEIQSISVELPFFSQQAKVKLTIAKPIFWLSSNNKLYVIDSQGRAIQEAMRLPQVKNLVTINDQTGFSTHIGQQVLAAGQINFIRQVIDQTKAAKVPIASLSLPPLAQELDLRTADQPYYIKFYLGGDPVTQVGQFLAARQNFANKGDNPSQYLDVRVNGKIFYQ